MVDAEQPVFGVTSTVAELDALTRTLDHLAQDFPGSRVHVGLVGLPGDAVDAVAGRWGNSVVSEATTTGAARSAICRAAGTEPVVMLRAGSVLDEIHGLHAAIASAADVAVVFAASTTHEPMERPAAVTSGWHSPALDRPGRIEADDGAGLVLSSVSKDLTSSAADVGGADCVVSTRLVGPGREIDWDPDIDDADVSTVDLALRIFRHPSLGARAHGAFAVRRPPAPAPHLLESEGAAASLHRFLAKNELFEMRVDGQRRDFLTTRRESRLDHVASPGLRPALGALKAHWRSPERLAKRWANLATRAVFARHVVSANPDEFATNVYFARDASWAFVGAANCGHADVLRWLRGHELGVPRDAVGLTRAGRLLTAADIGILEAGELLARPGTLVFTVVEDPVQRLERAWSVSFGHGAAPYPPAAALEAHWRRTARSSGCPERSDGFDFAAFLAAIAALPDERRDRRWRRISDALALSTLRYDAVVQRSRAPELLPPLGERIGFSTPRPYEPRPCDTLATSSSGLDPALVASVCGPDLRWAP